MIPVDVTAIRAGNTVICQRFRIVLSISDQASAYEKLGKEILQGLREFFADESIFPFPVVHIHDIGHQVKNGQAALERGTHFHGEHCYDATDFSLVISGVVGVKLLGRQPD